MGENTILVSACLCGVNCRYSGDSNADEKVKALFKSSILLPVCPEQLGGLSTPRAAAEIVNGAGKDVLLGKAKVMNENGEDNTEAFLRGAHEVLNIVKMEGITKAILKAKSPSCGCGIIYDGTFSGNKVEGNGVTAELLIQNGVEVITEDDL